MCLMKTVSRGPCSENSSTPVRDSFYGSVKMSWLEYGGKKLEWRQSLLAPAECKEKDKSQNSQKNLPNFTGEKCSSSLVIKLCSLGHCMSPKVSSLTAYLFPDMIKSFHPVYLKNCLLIWTAAILQQGLKTLVDLVYDCSPPPMLPHSYGTALRKGWVWNLPLGL